MADDDSTPTPDESAKPDAPATKDTADFKSEESKTRVLADLTSERAKRQELEARLKEIEDKDKSETERLTERLSAAEKRALDAARYEIALDKGLTRSQAKRLVGTTPEELAADADELLADLGASAPRRPSGDVGQGPRDTPETPMDPASLADAVTARRGH
jgi:hypothetical protein